MKRKHHVVVFRKNNTRELYYTRQGIMVLCTEIEKLMIQHLESYSEAEKESKNLAIKVTKIILTQFKNLLRERL